MMVATSAAAMELIVFRYSRLPPHLIRFFKSEIGSLLLLYLAFLVAGFVTTNILLLIEWAFPSVDPNILAVKVTAFTSQDGPVALFVVWCMSIILFAWRNPTQCIVRYYGKRLEEFSIVVFSAMLGTVIAVGCWQFGWKNLLPAVVLNAGTLLLIVVVRKLVSLKDRGSQAIAALLAGFAAVMFTFGPAYWPTWFTDYMTPWATAPGP